MFSSWILPFISFSGLLFGLLLRRIATEEIIPGTRYFHALQKALLLILVIALLYPVWFEPLLIVGILLGWLLGRTFRNRYFYLGLALALSFFFSPDFTLVVASLVFLYGLPYGTLLKKRTPEHISNTLMFFLVPFALLFVKETVISSLPFLLSITAGALFLRR